jgi:hypothetical protein
MKLLYHLPSLLLLSQLLCHGAICTFVVPAVIAFIKNAPLRGLWGKRGSAVAIKEKESEEEEEVQEVEEVVELVLEMLAEEEEEEDQDGRREAVVGEQALVVVVMEEKQEEVARALGKAIHGSS